MKKILGLALGLSLTCTSTIGLAEADIENLKLNNLKSYEREATTMLPLREISEALGFKVEWNKQDRKVELKKGPLYSDLKVGENRYFLGKKAPTKLSKAPEIKEGLTYVPEEFFKDILGLDYTFKAGSFNLTREDKLENLDLTGYVKRISEGDQGKRILVSVEDGTSFKGDISLLFSEDALVKKGRIEDLKVGSKVELKVSPFMTMSLPPQAILYEIKIDDFLDIKEVENGDISYFEIAGNEKISGLVKDYVDGLRENDLYEDLKLDYEIQLLNKEILSVNFYGKFNFSGREKTLQKTFNLNLKNNEEVTYETYFKADDKSREALEELLSKKVKEAYNKEFEAEGRMLYFTETGPVVYYYELDDSVEGPTFIRLMYSEVEDLIK